MIIAVDGPAASGKGTVARAVARHFVLPYMDTGLLYRAVGLTLLRRGGDPDDAAAALAAAGFEAHLLTDEGLRSDEVGNHASRVSVHPGVRAALLERQRSFAQMPGGAVLDGRDIGTVVAPAAHAKLYVTASPEARARRRFAELGETRPLEDVLADIHARDARDSARTVAPLRAADDADLLDTSELTIDQAVQRALALVEARLKRSA